MARTAPATIAASAVNTRVFSLMRFKVGVGIGPLFAVCRKSDRTDDAFPLAACCSHAGGVLDGLERLHPRRVDADRPGVPVQLGQVRQVDVRRVAVQPPDHHARTSHGPMSGRRS